ncbi:hypothetical protein JXC34_04965 [Candidatus Woesearchaeota archaeon]|nr:hypothetical protein [Candidatus Woesearchaeota archaeon]
MQRKNYLLKVRITSDQRDQLEKIAYSCGLSMADFIRSVISSNNEDLKSSLSTNMLYLQSMLKKFESMEENLNLVMGEFGIKKRIPRKYKFNASFRDSMEVPAFP